MVHSNGVSRGRSRWALQRSTQHTLSGEKMSTRITCKSLPWGPKALQSWRVTESSISTLMVPNWLIAMNLLHGDHMAAPIPKGKVVAAVFESHDSGTPHTILAKCWECDSYSSYDRRFGGKTSRRVIDMRSGGTDDLEVPATNLRQSLASQA